MKSSRTSHQIFWASEKVTETQDTENQAADNFELFPDEIYLEIFSRLDFTVLGRFATVSKRWNVVLEPTFNNKRDLLSEKIFGTEDWDLHFINNGMTPEEKQQAYRSIPLNIDEIPCPEFPNKMMIDSWKFTYFPKNLSINSYGDLLKQKFDKNRQGYYSIERDIIEKFGEKLIEKSGWKAMSKASIRNTSGKFFSVQRRIVNNLNLNNNFQSTVIKPSSLLSAIVFSSTSYFKWPSPITDTLYTCCKEKVKNKQLIVGNTISGLIVDQHYRLTRQDIGMNALIDY